MSYVINTGWVETSPENYHGITEMGTGFGAAIHAGIATDKVMQTS